MPYLGPFFAAYPKGDVPDEILEAQSERGLADHTYALAASIDRTGFKTEPGYKQPIAASEQVFSNGFVVDEVLLEQAIYQGHPFASKVRFNRVIERLSPEQRRNVRNLPPEIQLDLMLNVALSDVHKSYWAIGARRWLVGLDLPMQEVTRIIEDKGPQTGVDDIAHVLGLPVSPSNRSVLRAVNDYFFVDGCNAVSFANEAWLNGDMRAVLAAGVVNYSVDNRTCVASLFGAALRFNIRNSLTSDCNGANGSFVCKIRFQTMARAFNPSDPYGTRNTAQNAQTTVFNAVTAPFRAMWRTAVVNIEDDGGIWRAKTVVVAR